MGLIERVINGLKDRRDNILKGGINCIPLPFPRFRKEFPGIEQATYYLVSGATKAGKTQLANFIFVYNTLIYAYKHPDKLTPRIFYYNLEETEEDITLRFMAYLLFILSNIEISPTDLKSTDERKPLPTNILDILNSKEYTDILKFYEDHVSFMSSRNPTGMWKDITAYATSHGTSHYTSYTYTDESGNSREGRKFSHYVPDNPNEYVIIITDHVSLLEREKGLDLRETINKHSEYCIIFRNRYGYIPVEIQQQNIETIGLDAYKADKIRPTVAGLADSKATGKDCTVMMGITNPASVGKMNDLGYDITKLKGNFRSLEIVLNRKGQSNSICPLYFNGAVNYYKELPLPQDYSAMEKVYDYILNKGKKAILFFTQLIKR